MNRDSEAFISLLTSHQGPLYAYILTLMTDRSSAQDVLQEANLTLWRKAGDFQEGTSFFAWSSKIAYFHVLSHRRKKSRDRLVFDDDVLDYLAERQASRMEGEAARLQRALKNCLTKLPTAQRSLVEQRYEPGGSVQDIAASSGKTVGAISQTLYRIRDTLHTCVGQTLHNEDFA